MAYPHAQHGPAWLIFQHDSDLPNPEINYINKYSGSSENWRKSSMTNLLALYACFKNNTCTKKQKTVMHNVQLKNNFPVLEYSIEGHVGGEDIWARAVMSAMTNLGFTPLVVENVREAVELYSNVGDLTAMVLLEDANVAECWENRRNQKFRCAQSKFHPNDIPIWKMFSFTFWPSCAHPLGEAWCLVPENYKSWSPTFGHTYLGYSIEAECSQTGFVPWKTRRNRTYILAKNSDYFHNTKIELTKVINGLSEENAGFEFAMGIDGFEVPHVENLGRLAQAEFHQALGQSKALIGLGDPVVSPSPHDALCRGVAFINPIASWNEERKWDRSKWSTQHPALAYLDPPYVYNVLHSDTEAIKSAIRQAMQTEVSRRVPAHMTVEAMKERVDRIVLEDWRERAREIQAMRSSFGGEVTSTVLLKVVSTARSASCGASKYSRSQSAGLRV
ncbi:hypothetical protein HDU82_005163 [Entophlyctis luteolus]|nr:hypothetical protein HDU82_005163 [Entophlyctis luteolus]